MNDPLRIITNTYTTITGWTWENFLKYVEYERMFNQRGGRVAPGRPGDGEDAAFILHRETPGFNGFTLEVHTFIRLMNADGDVPPFEPPTFQ